MPPSFFLSHSVVCCVSHFSSCTAAAHTLLIYNEKWFPFAQYIIIKAMTILHMISITGTMISVIQLACLGVPTSKCYQMLIKNFSFRCFLCPLLDSCCLNVTYSPQALGQWSRTIILNIVSHQSAPKTRTKLGWRQYRPRRASPQKMPDVCWCLQYVSQYSCQSN